MKKHLQKHLLSILALVVMLSAFATSASAATSVTLTKVSTSQSHQLFLKSDGTVWVRGINSDGELGDGTTVDRTNPVQLTSLSSIVDVVAGEKFSMFLASNGDLYTTGKNHLGQLGIGKADLFRTTPSLILQGVSSITTIDGNQGLALKEGRVYQWGDGTGGSPGLGMPDYNYFYPIGIQYPVHFSKISREFLLSENGDLYEFPLREKKITKIKVSNVKAIASDVSNALLLLNDGSVLQRKPNEINFIAVPALKNIVEITVDGSHFLARDADGSVWSWGRNKSGEAGIGKFSEYVDSPTKVFSNASNISNVLGLSILLKLDGSVYISGSLYVSNGSGLKYNKFTKWLSPTVFGIDGSEPSTGNPSDNNENPKPVKLTDIKGHWAEKDIQFLLELGIVKGFSNNSFQPNAKVTREEFIKMLVESLKLEKTTTTSIFEDVPETRWSNPYIATAIEQGIIIPDENGDRFSPNTPITRFDMALAVGRALKLSNENNEFIYAFKDNHLILSHQNTINSVVESKIIQGYLDETFRPNNSATRAESVVVIKRTLDFIKILPAN